jgi:hypothetical protein
MQSEESTWKTKVLCERNIEMWRGGALRMESSGSGYGAVVVVNLGVALKAGNIFESVICC